MPPVTFDVLARDRASATFDKIARSTETLESRFGRLQRTARNFAGGLIGAEVGKSILEAADKLELSRSRLETVTANIGGNFEAIASQVGAADEKLARFGYTSAETEGALATLEAVTKDPQKAFNDLGLAADIARGRNISLGESVAILSRIETGHVAMLSRLGIATKDAAGHTLTQAQALQMLTDLYGGAASKYAETFAGKQAAVRAELQNSAAQIGVALLPAAVQLANVLSHDLLPPLVSTAQWLDRNRKVIEPLAKAALIGVGAWKAYGLAVKVAGELTGLVGTRATVAAGRVAAASAIEAASTRKAAAVMLPDLRAMALAEDAAAAAGRRRMLSLGAGALGAGALVAGGYTHGTTSSALTGAGGGALVGSMFGPEGAVIGAGLGAGAALIGNTQTAGSVQSKLTKEALSGPAGYAAVKAQLDRANSALESGQAIRGGGAVVTQRNLAAAALKAADAQNHAKTAAQKYTAALHDEDRASAATAQKLLATSAAQDQLRQAMHQAAQVAADNGRVLRGNSDAALANRDAVRQQVTAALGVIDAMKAQGRSAQAQADMLDVLTQAVEINATKTYGDKTAVDALLTSLGLIPGKAEAAAAAMSDYANAQVAVDAAIDPKKLAALSQTDTATTKKRQDQVQSILKSFTTDFSPIVSKASETAAKAADSAAKKAADAAKQRFNDLRQSMLSDLQSIRDAVKSTADSLMSFASITNAMRGTDIMGNAATGNVLRNRQQQAAQLKQFASLYDRLAGLGLDAVDLHDFITTGPDAIPAMQQILRAGRGEVRQLSALQRQVQTTAGRLGREDTASQDATLIHRDLVSMPKKIGSELRKGLADLHLSVSATELDRRNGMRVVAAVG